MAHQLSGIPVQISDGPEIMAVFRFQAAVVLHYNSGNLAGHRENDGQREILDVPDNRLTVSLVEPFFPAIAAINT